MKMTSNKIRSFPLKVVVISPALLFFLLFFSSVTFAGKTYNVVLITSSNSKPYVSTARNIETTINKNKIPSIQTRTLTIEEFYSLKKSLSEKTDLFVPIGQRALKEILKYSGNTPVLSSLISRFGFNNIINNGKNTKKHPNIGAIYIDQPLKRQLLFSQLVLPNASRLGFIISSGNKHAIDKLSSLLDSDTHRIEILNPGNNVISALSRVLDDSDVIIALPDPIIFNLRTTRNILLSAYRKRIPLIGFSESYVKAGAVAGIYSTPESIGKQTGEVISIFIKQTASNNKPYSLPITLAKYFSISVNSRVSRSFGLPVLDTAILKKKLLQAEKGQRK